MSWEGNKSVISRFFQKGFNERNLAVVEQVFAPNHVLQSPAVGAKTIQGTEYIKKAIEDYHNHSAEAACTIVNQIVEGDWVATAYTLDDRQGQHMGVMVSRLVDNMIQESFIVARDVSEPSLTENRIAADPEPDEEGMRKVFN
jgi:predicted SnoaL-like aldol condensation-catalyzing enzyme